MRVHIRTIEAPHTQGPGEGVGTNPPPREGVGSIMIENVDPIEKPKKFDNLQLNQI